MKRYTCDLCGSRQANAQRLKRHHELRHSGLPVPVLVTVRLTREEWRALRDRLAPDDPLRPTIERAAS